MARTPQGCDAANVRSNQRHAALPIGRTARIAFEIEALRTKCSKAAQVLIRRTPLDEAELEECARLDDALAEAHRMLTGHIRNIMLSRLGRRSRKNKAR
jgi:hypothetical protein